MFLVVTLACLSLFMSSCSDPYEPMPDPTEMLGDVMFWTNSDYFGGRIKVTFRNATMTLTHYYSTSTPSCGSQGCATYENVPIGTYSYHAENSWYTWNGEITVREGQCSKMRLYVSKGVTSANEDAFDDYGTSDVSFELYE